VPDFGDVSQVAPQLYDLPPGAISGPINAGRTGVVAKLVDKKEPTADEIKQNLDRSREQILSRRQEDAFELFATNVLKDYQKRGLIRVNAKAATQDQGE